LVGRLSLAHGLHRATCYEKVPRLITRSFVSRNPHRTVVECAAFVFPES
jgi:hypothetical protein